MANSLIIRRGTSLAKRSKALRAAQYVRMSTDYQRYSIQNQAAAIATFAGQHGLTIVRTYVDEGRSGLRIKNRAGLAELIEDVISGQADFDHVLVYDVSRWGRFQDVDESAHYEFICKQSGIKIVYCAEQFENDGSLLSSIFKNIKRVMAAEFSRELSVKVHAGQSRVAGLGYRVGGPVAFGLRRELIDEAQCPKGWLTKGERKALHTDRVRLRLGSSEEAALVRRIFHEFVVERRSYIAIARQLNHEEHHHPSGGKWTSSKIHTILSNENYVGNLTYNRTSRRLGQKLVKNPCDQWVRSEAVVEPIVDSETFERAQKLLAERRLEIPEDQMLVRLRVLLARKGRLSSHLIDQAPGVSSPTALIRHFGSLREAYALIGYTPKYNFDWIDTRGTWKAMLADHVSQVANALAKSRFHIDVDQAIDAIRVDGEIAVSFVVARHTVKRKAHHVPQWRISRRNWLSGILVVLRLDEANRNVLDYLLMPASKINARYLCLSGLSLPRGMIRIASPAELMLALKAGIRRRAKRS